MHVGNGSLGVGFVVEQNVSCATVGSKLTVERQVQVLNLAVLAKDLSKVVFVHVLGETFDNNLGASGLGRGTASATS